ILPGLGAFAIRPGAEAQGLAALSRFLDSIACHASNDTTRRLQSSYHTFRIQEPSGKYRSVVTLPARDDSGKKLRGRPYPEQTTRRLSTALRRRAMPLTRPAKKGRHQDP